MGMTKIIAYYLPQYHYIPENDRWWGKNFTEWTNVRNCRPLFHKHRQPYLPLNENYYNLLDRNTLEWQVSLCSKYGIYGWAIYHYWYKGRLLLEKPTQNLLLWKDLPIHFCLTWANHDWTNSWAGGCDLLVEQEYGEEKDWSRHYNYLSPFFHDDRYIKINNRPLFIIYRPQDVPALDKMVSFFNSECRKDGFDGIYIVNTIWMPQEMKEKRIINSCDALTFKEFRFSQIALRNDKSLRIRNRVNNFVFQMYLKRISADHLEVYSYKTMTNTSFRLMSKLTSDRPLYYNVFTSWDTTPRYKEKASIIIGATPSSFKKHLKRMLRLSNDNSADYLFVRAWNEWGQGMTLEPSQLYGYGYLEAVHGALLEERL